MTFNNWQEKLTALSLREKLMLAVALLVVVWGGWDTFFYQPLVQKQKLQQQELSNLQIQITAQQQVAQELEKRMHSNPNLAVQNQLLDVKNEYTALQQQIQQLGQKFVAPSLMAQLLNDLLKQNKPLTLLNLDTLPVTALLESKQQQHIIYKHGLILRFAGNYLATVNYLKSLEALPWHFIWSKIDYQVKDYPQAEIILQIYTLSLEKSWLNV